MENLNNDRAMQPVFSKKVKAGKRRTYFFDVRTTRANDYFLTLTESRKRQDSDGYDRHKIFLYKEDMNKFIDDLTETINYIKTTLMPEYDFDQFSNQYDENGDYIQKEAAAEDVEAPTQVENLDPPSDAKSSLDDIKWEL